jgi:hypothetical protein
MTKLLRNETWYTFVFRLRQAAQASETRALLGGNNAGSPRGDVDGRRGRNDGRGTSFGLADEGSMIGLKMPWQSAPRPESRGLVTTPHAFSLLKGGNALRSSAQYMQVSRVLDICGRTLATSCTVKEHTPLTPAGKSVYPGWQKRKKESQTALHNTA